MVMTSPSSPPPAVVMDASVLIVLCAKEAGNYPLAITEIRQYVQNGFVAYAPGVIGAESLHVLCLKLQNGFLTPLEHKRSIQRLQIRMRGILPPPGGDSSLLIRAEEIRGTYTCRRSADGLYIALAEQLALSRPTELVTFDVDMFKQTSSTAPAVTVRLLTP